MSLDVRGCHHFLATLGLQDCKTQRREADEKAKMKSRPSKPASYPKKDSRRKDAAMVKGSFPVVAIGASAGGLEAYKELLHALPSDTGMAFVLIQHLDPSHASMLIRSPGNEDPRPANEMGIPREALVLLVAVVGAQEMAGWLPAVPIDPRGRAHNTRGVRCLAY
jgi:hypothetical protein